MEEYFDGFDKNTLQDMRHSFKSITSLLAGINIDQGLFTVNDKSKSLLLNGKMIQEAILL
jgi:hypothetical protein